MNSSNHEMERETAVPSAARKGSLLEAIIDTSAVRRGSQLHSLSIEHAAIAQELRGTDIDLLVRIGRGRQNKEIARELEVLTTTIDGRIALLKERLRMNRLELAVLGYALAGQVDPDVLRSAA